VVHPAEEPPGPAIKHYKRLPYTFIYLGAFFLLADGLNTTGSMVGIVENQKVHFSFLQKTYLGLVQAICSIISTHGYWYFQKWRKIPTKRMFQVTNFVTVFIPFWGMLGLWTKKVGYHNVYVRALSPLTPGGSSGSTRRSLASGRRRTTRTRRA
jgi:MFS-type transporter involved in bile tolerance (Atg22 family)